MVVRTPGGLFSVIEFEGMSDEAHFSAEQPGPGTPSRLPLAHGDAGRTCSDPCASQPRPRQAVGLSDFEVGQGPTDSEIATNKIITLSKRSDFLAANAGKRAPMPGFVLLVRPRSDGDPAMRVGYTVTKKIGGAVIRNRMKRRFRALAREILPVNGVAGADHVLIGRAGGLERDFGALRHELVKALGKVAK